MGSRDASGQGHFINRIYLYNDRVKIYYNAQDMGPTESPIDDTEGSSMGQLVRISGLDANNLRTALKHRPNKLNSSLAEDDAAVKEEKESSYGEEVKVIDHLTREQVHLSPTAEDEIAARYGSGMSMANIAKQYGCHYQTIKRVLQNKRICI